ncbi:MAG: sulfur carrier protein ThiS [Phascolarctobacterium sp.]
MIINGKQIVLQAPISLSELLEQQGYRANMVAVELNGCIVKRCAYADTMLNDADKLEIVSFVGGG